MQKQIKRIIPNRIKEYIRNKRKSNPFKNKRIKETFTQIKETRYWNSSESISGDGSEIAITKDLRSGLEKLFKSLSIESMLDLPCGDFNWMKKVDLTGVDYIGADIVESLIDSNQHLYGLNNVKFLTLDVTNSELPNVDLIFCRDCLVHLSFKDIYRALINIKKSRSKYLIITSFFNTKINKDIITGEWRKLNFELQPFLFNPPIEFIDEKYTKKGLKYADKTMCLWKIEDIKIPLKLRLFYWFT